MSKSRRASRDFYRLTGDPLSETASEPGSEIDSETTSQFKDLVDDAEEENSTQLSESDEKDVSISEFVRKSVSEKNLSGFTNTIGQIRRERAASGSAQQELVNDNYKRLIHAAEALEYLSVRGDLANVEELTDPVDKLAKFAAKMSF